MGARVVKPLFKMEECSMIERKIFSVHKPWRCTKPGKYSWPNALIPDRTVEIYDDDVFTEEVPGSGVWNKQTGLMMLGINIPVEFMERMPMDNLPMELL